MNLIIVLSASLLLSFVLGGASGRACAEDVRAGDDNPWRGFWPQLSVICVIDWVLQTFLWTVYLASWNSLIVAAGASLVCALCFAVFYAVGQGRAAA